MKLKTLVLMLAIALTSFAQTATQPAPSSPAPDTKSCACCTHDKSDSGAKCSGCKDGKCPMMSGSHEGMKCPMMSKDGKMADGKADGKACCSSNKCPMHAKDGKGKGCCCGNMDEQKSAGM